MLLAFFSSMWRTNRFMTMTSFNQMTTCMACYNYMAPWNPDVL